MPEPSNIRRSRGRPRSESAREAILRAALDLLQERGFGGISVDSIAERAQVGRATVYRWWPNKAAVVMDAFLADTAPQIPFPDTGSALEDLRRQLRRVIRVFNRQRVRRPFVALIAESQHDPVLASALRERFIAARRNAARDVLARGIARGELRADLDLDIALDAIYGAQYYRFLVSGAPLTPAYADALIAQLGPALATQPAMPEAERCRRAATRA